MKIQQLKINNYGKIKDREINLGEHINIIYGKNESGKSTILKYIINSFYGISKNKRGKEYSDFEKYEPWIGEDFSGKLSYKLDNGNKYEVYRDFRKKNPKIFNERMEDISKEFSIDKVTGNAFFYEQTKVDEQLFLTTFVSSQQETCLQKNEQGVLIQKIANLVGTGEDSVSYKLAVERINRRQLEEVGTTRTREKPINNVNNKIMQLEQEKENLQKYKELQYITEEKENQIIAEIEELEIEQNILSELKILYEEKIIENEKVLVKENIKKQNIEKIREIDNELEKIHRDNKDLITECEKQSIDIDGSTTNLKNDKNLKIKLIIIYIGTIVANILQFMLLKNTVANIVILSLSVILICVLSQYVLNKNAKRENEENAKKLIQKEKAQKYEILKEKIRLLENEINILEKNNNEIQDEIQNCQDRIKNEFIQKRAIIVSKYKQIPIREIEEITENNIKYKIQKIQEEIRNRKINLHEIQVDKSNIIPKLDTLAHIEEQCANCYQHKQELEKLDLSINLAKQVLEECYEKMRHTVTPKFTKNLSLNMQKITNGKYIHINFHDEQGIMVENENGEYVHANKLSIGTIEQLYLSLRLSMIEDLSEEKLPIILDETFAYFDEERLQNFLLYIDELYADRQILIFTNTYREKQILDRNRIRYNIQNL